MKKTPLYNTHIELGAEVIEFGGWLMPVKYKGIIEEHDNTRQKVSLFDTCHMGELIVSGKGAFETIQKLIPRDASKFKPNSCYYTHLCNDNGGILDDIIIYKFDENYYFIVINASTIDQDYNWINSHKALNCTVKNVSDETGKIDVQGPEAKKLVNDLLNEIAAPHNDALSDLKYYTFKEILWQGKKIIISRTGYTGELGYEIYSDAKDIVKIWNELLEKGKPYGVMPAGLGARDTLRLEMGYPLMGQDFNSSITPIDFGFEAIVNFSKENFMGKNALLKHKDSPERKYKVPFIIEKGGIARSHTSVKDKSGKEIGQVTSGTFSPTLKKAIGIALLNVQLNKGDILIFDIRGRNVEGKVDEIPFVKQTSIKNN